MSNDNTRSLHRPDLGLLIQPDTNQYRLHLADYPLYAIDNGCFAKGDSFDADRWFAWLQTLPQRNCLFVAAPDVVGDALATWRRSARWLREIRDVGYPAALVAQDGLEQQGWEDKEWFWGTFDALFIGGTTDWKLSLHSSRFMSLAKERGKWVHVGRVNTWKRYRWAVQNRADSVDGTYLRFGPNKNLPILLGWLDKVAA